MRRCIPWVIGLTLGCSGASNDVNVAGAGASAAGSSASAGAAGSNGGLGGGAGTIAGGAGQAGAGTTTGGANAGGASGSGGAAAVTPLSLLPLAVGNKWTFSGPPSSSCTVRPYEESITAYELHAGRMAYRSVDTCDPNTPVWLSEQDGSISQTSDTTWAVTLAAPLVDGAKWESDGVHFVWQHIPSINLKSGTFKNCWQRSIVEQPNAFARTYCPGIGPILNQNSGMPTELTSYVVEP